MGFLSSLVGGGLGVLGSVLGGKSQEKAARAAAQASAPLNVRGPFGQAIFSDGVLTGSLSPAFQSQLNALTSQANKTFGAFSGLDIPGLERQQLSTLRNLAQPEQDRIRAQVRNEVFQRGRLGLGTRGARTGQNVQPELASLAEGEATADLLRQLQSQTFARNEQARLLDQFLTLQNQALGLSTLPTNQASIGVQARTPQSIAALAGVPGQSRANFVTSFLGTLGSNIQIPGFGGGTFKIPTNTGGGFRTASPQQLSGFSAFTPGTGGFFR